MKCPPAVRLECTCLDFEALWSPLWTGNGNFTGNLQISTREALASLELGLHYSKKSREAAIVGQVGSAASRSSLLLVHLVSTGIITREYRDMQSISQY